MPTSCEAMKYTQKHNLSNAPLPDKVFATVKPKHNHSMKKTKQSESNAALPGVIEVPVPAVPGMTAEQKRDVVHFDKVVELGTEVVHKMVEVGEKYYQLCLYCRTEKLAPKLVSEGLRKVGFRKQRIAEINRVWQCSDELWNQFEARTIGFRETLEIARGAGMPPGVTRLLAESSGVSAGAVEESLADEKEEGVVLNANTGEVEDNAKTPQQIAEAGRLSIAKKIGEILRLAEKVRQAEKQLHLKTPYRGANNAIGNGWRVVLKKENKRKTVSANDE